MRSSYGSAITHVQSGMKILSEVKYDEKTRCYQHDVLVASKLPYVSIEVLKEMFMRVDHRVTQVSSSRRLRLRVFNQMSRWLVGEDGKKNSTHRNQRCQLYSRLY